MPSRRESLDSSARVEASFLIRGYGKCVNRQDQLRDHKEEVLDVEKTIGGDHAQRGPRSDSEKIGTEEGQ